MENQSENLENGEAKVEAEGATEEQQAEPIAADKEEKTAKIDYKEKYFYLAAEMENMRKRFEREKDSLVKYSNEKVMGDLIEIVDNFERTVSALAADQDPKVKNIASGINMVSGQFLGVLKRFGLTQIESLGKTFDPNFHEALGTEEAEGKKEQEII